MADASGIYAAAETGFATGVAGLVYRTDVAVHILLPGGLYRYDWPDQGLLGDLTGDRAKHPAFWGRWRQESDSVVVERSGVAARFAVASDGLVDVSGRRFVRLPNELAEPDLSGLWLREASISDKPRIVFSADGRFESAGGLLGLIAMPEFVAGWGPYPPNSLMQWPDGGGDYVVALYTLQLRRDDGPVLNLLALPAAPDRMRFGYTWFRRAAR